MAVQAAAKATASNSLQAMREAKDASDVDETSDPGRTTPQKIPLNPKNQNNAIEMA